MQGSRMRVGAVGRVVLVVLALLGAVGSDVEAATTVLKCQRTIATQLGKMVALRVNLLRKCQERIVKGKGSAPCPNVAMTLKLDTAAMKFRTAVNRTCGGGDRNCGVGSDDESLSALGWDVAICPGLAGADCNQTIENCNDVVDCARCVSDAAVDRVIALAYDGLVSYPPGTAASLSGRHRETAGAVSDGASEVAREVRAKSVGGEAHGPVS